MDFSKPIPKLLSVLLSTVNFAFVGVVLSKFYSLYKNIKMGWDQLDSMLTGLVLGGMAGMILAILLMIKVRPGRLKRFFNYSLVLFGLIIAFIGFRMVTISE